MSTQKKIPVKKPNMTKREKAEYLAFEAAKKAYVETTGSKEDKKKVFQDEYNRVFFKRMG